MRINDGTRISLVSGVLLLGVLMGACAGESNEPSLGGDTTTASDSVAGKSSEAAPPSTSSVAPAAGAADSSAGTTAVAAVDVLGRKVIRNGSLSLEVESVTESYERVTTIASSLGGYVAEGSYSGSDEARRGRVVIRVPADRYDRAMSELQGLAETVTSSTSTTQDVTGEVSDLDASLRNLRAVEAQYVAFLNQARNVQDLLQVQQQLLAVRGDIERTEGRLALLNRLTDLATITVQLAPVSAVPQVQHSERSPGGAAAAAWDASLDTLRNVAIVGVAVLVYSWWLVPFIAVAAYLAWRHLRLRRGVIASGAS